MKALAIILTLCTFFTSFQLSHIDSIKKEDSLNGIQAVKITLLFPVVDSTGKFLGRDTFQARIYYDQDITAVRVPLYKRRNGEIVSVHNTVFVAANDSIFGYVYEDNYRDSLTMRRTDRSRFMKGETWLTQIYCYKNLTACDTALRSITIDSLKGIKEVVYDSQDSEDTTIKHSYYMTFADSLKSVPFSLSRELDSIYGTKLCKFWMVHYPFTYEGIKIDEVSYGYFLDRFEVPKDDMIFRVLRKYRKDILKCDS